MLDALGIAVSSWHHKPVPKERHQGRGPKAQPVPPAIESVVVAIATANPWYGYKRIAVMCRRAGHKVTIQPTIRCAGMAERFDQARTKSTVSSRVS